MTDYPGTVLPINNDEEKYKIDYNDGEKEVLEITNEVWRYSY